MKQGLSVKLTANSLTGRAIGMAFFAVFGGIWLALGLYAAGQLTVVSVLMTVSCVMALLAGAAYLSRQSERFPRVANDPAQGRMFGWVNFGQWIVIAIVVVSLGRMHQEHYVINAIALIVGVHFLPPARLFHYALHYVTGALMVVWAVATVWLVPAESLQSVTAMGTGLLLWLSAAATLGMALARTRRARVEMAW
jgi:magnesium-transporting ATPase (P-type)